MLVAHFSFIYIKGIVLSKMLEELGVKYQITKSQPLKDMLPTFGFKTNKTLVENLHLFHPRKDTKKKVRKTEKEKKERHVK